MEKLEIGDLVAMKPNHEYSHQAKLGDIGVIINTYNRDSMPYLVRWNSRKDSFWYGHRHIAFIEPSNRLVAHHVLHKD